jgi:capsular exopolysaccharide synthesis family protein
MAEYVSIDELKKEESSSEFSFAEIWTIVVLHWQWIVLSTVIALTAAFLYLRYTQPVFTSAMKVLIKDDNGKGGAKAGQMNLEEMGIISNSNGFDNELEILSSTNVNSRVVKSLKLYVSYAVEGKVKKMEQYQSNPIIVDMPQHQLAVLRVPIEVEMTKAAQGLHVLGKMRIAGQKDPVTFEHDVKKLPGSINTPMGVIMFQQNPGAKWDSEKYYATILPVESAARLYRSKLSASPTTKFTTVANVTFTDTQVGRSLDYLSELIKCYNEDANEDKNEVAMKTEEFIKARIDDIRGELDVTEGELEQYKKSNELINLANNATTALTSTTEYQKKQVEFETQLNLINALVNYVNNPANAMQVIPANLGLADASLNATISKYNEAVLQRNRLLKSSSEDNPFVKNLTAQIDEMWPSIRMSLDAIRNDVLMQKSSADRQYSMYSSRISSTPTQERALTNMNRQQEIKASLYLMLLQKREENYISLASTAAKARVIDSPQLVGKVSPKSSMIWLVALALGVGFPIGVFFLMSLLRYRIGGREDIEKLTKISILADIPLAGKGVDGEKALVVRENTNNSMEEAFRGLRTNLRFILEEGEKVILCTSCIPGEGKTFVSTNLAMSLALMDKKVVIVGLDIRKPRLVKLFNIPANKKGITTFLSGNDRTFAALDEQIIHGVVNKNLDVLPAGIIPPNPGELISREQLDLAVELLKEHYDYVLLDTPPVGLVSDTLSIGRVAEMCLFVCRADYTPRANFDLINSLRADNKLPKINIVLNALDMRKKKYGYYYGYGKYGKYGKYAKYGYGYGRYGHYGLYGKYGAHESKEHTEK